MKKPAGEKYRKFCPPCFEEGLIVLLSDATELAAFTTAGAVVATEASVSRLGAGAFADILLDHSPFILLDFYASCAVLGGNVYWEVTTLEGAIGTATAACAAVTVGLRMIAVSYGWSLPTAQSLVLTREKRRDD